MKITVISFLVTITIAFCTSALAIPPGMTIEFTKSPMGKVVLDGNTHPAKGIMCDDCHPKVFEQKKGAATITMPDHEGGKFCFTCHNGTKAWASKDNCNKCHVK